MAFGKKEPAASGNKTTGKAAGKAASKRKDQDRQPTQICTSWLLWCFEQAEAGAGTYLRMTCKMSSRSAEGEGYGNGVYIDVMARIQPDGEGNMTDIPEDDYSGGWIVVDGTIRANDWESNGKHGTNLTIWASTVRHGGDSK